MEVAARRRSHLYGCAAVEPTDERRRRPGHRPGREARRRPRRRATSPSSAATCSTRRSSTCSSTTAPGRGGEIQLTDALQELAGATERGRRPVHGVRLPRPPLRHRRPARLPQGGRAARGRAARPRRPTSCLAARSYVDDDAGRPSEDRSTSTWRTSSAPITPLLAARPAAAGRAGLHPGRGRRPRRWTLPPFDNSAMDGYAVRARRRGVGAARRPGACCRSSATSRPAARRPRRPARA